MYKLTESLAGRKQIFEMAPLDFFEFLQFKEIDTEPLAACRFTPFRRIVFTQYKAAYEEFIQYGGFPEVVLADSTEENLRRPVNYAHLRTSFTQLRRRARERPDPTFAPSFTANQTVTP